jgi:hypothetical protein
MTIANQPPITDDPRSQLAANLLPREWAAVANKPGASKKRHQLRQMAEAEQRMKELRAAGAKCATCRSYRANGPEKRGPGARL